MLFGRTGNKSVTDAYPTISPTRSEDQRANVLSGVVFRSPSTVWLAGLFLVHPLAMETSCQAFVGESFFPYPNYLLRSGNFCVVE